MGHGSEMRADLLSSVGWWSADRLHSEFGVWLRDRMQQGDAARMPHVQHLLQASNGGRLLERLVVLLIFRMVVSLPPTFAREA